MYHESVYKEYLSLGTEIMAIQPIYKTEKITFL